MATGMGHTDFVGWRKSNNPRGNTLIPGGMGEGGSLMISLSLRAIPGAFHTEENCGAALSNHSKSFKFKLNLNHYKSFIFKLNLKLSWIWYLLPDKSKHDLIAIVLHLAKKSIRNIRR